MNSSKALLFDIYRGTSHDGPGQRNTVFFKGCPLSCKWCHNPEGISSKPLVWWQQKQCIGCLSCHKACKHGANILTENGITIDRSKCVTCGECVKACPAEAMIMCGEEWDVDKLVREMIKYKPYYDRTGGGVTASGGEAMLQYKIVEEFFTKLHENGITTALDTCGFIKTENYDDILPVTDYVLYDLKLIDSELHRSCCGQPNALILENAKHIVGEIVKGESNAEFWIRTPLIPGATDTEENLKGISDFVVHELGAENVTRWELCSFNNSCISKYERLGKNWEFAKQHILTRKHVNSLRQTAIDVGFPEDQIFVTGIVNEDII